MREHELISVIIPVYNISPYIERCVQSVLRQSYSSIEIILVDDGSTDGSGTILDRLAYEDVRIKVIHQTNGGVTKARLTGVEAAAGDWIGFVDGDDFVESEMYEHLLHNAHIYNAEISHCGYKMVFANRVDYYYNKGGLTIQDNRTGLKDLLDGTFVEPGLWNKLFRRSLFHELLHNNQMDTSIKNMEDLLMNFYLFREANKSVYEDFCPYHYVIREGSAATKKKNKNKLRDPLRVLKIIRRELQGDPILLQSVNTRIAGKLIQLAVSEKDGKSKCSYQIHARRELRKLLPTLLKGKYSNRTKILSAWAVISPSSYRSVHLLYSRFRGTDRKYNFK